MDTIVKFKVHTCGGMSISISLVVFHKTLCNNVANDVRGSLLCKVYEETKIWKKKIEHIVSAMEASSAAT